ncbi:MAG: L,D-transpeptidase family protein [Kiritimatiellae bacterium]|nr:L,D-transpeptidase family protein [Kiritimatiellia bacterium]
MALDPNFKDNLTLMGSQDRPRYLMPLLALLAVAIIAVVVYYAVVPFRPSARTTATIQPAQPNAGDQAAAGILGAVKTMLASNNFALARETCYELLQNAAGPETIGEAEEMLGRINIGLLLSPAPMPEKTEYVVQSGDTLERLAKKNGTTVQLIQKCNSLRGKMIHPGDRLRIFHARLAIVVSKTKNNLLLTANDRFLKRYPVGTGKFGTTPAGTFVISDKIAEPPWWRPDGRMIPFGDKENVLGTRWMSLIPTGETPKVRGYGIHGTWEPDTIGKQLSDGCIRMINTDVEELFLIVPAGTPVTIAE